MIQENSTAIQIILASTHTIFREGLRNLLHREPDLHVVAEAGEANEVLKLVGDTDPDIVLLDSTLRGLSAMKPQGGLKMLFGKAPTLLLGAAIDELDAAQALREGAGGFVLKESSTDLLIQGIRNIVQGQYWLGEEAMPDRWTALSRAAEYSRQSARLNVFGLTVRELEVVQQIVSGFSNKEIAAQLTISDDTVKHHLSNIFDKIGVYNRLELALFAIHHGLVGVSGRNGKVVRNDG